MKKIKLDYLTLRLPADKNFIEFANYAANSNIIALCKALFPDNRAIVLHGLENPVSPVSFTAGAIYYNGEIYAVDAFAYQNTVKISFCIREVVTNVTYKSGDELPGYTERKMFPIQHWDSEQPTEVLAWGNMIKLKELNNTSAYDNYRGITGTVQCNPILKHVLININVELTSSANAAVRIKPPLIPDQFLGYITLLGVSTGVNIYTPLEPEEENPIKSIEEIPAKSVALGAVVEKKYKLFAYNQELYLAEAFVNDFSDSSQGVTFKTIHDYFSSKIGAQLSFSIFLNHQILAQL